MSDEVERQLDVLLRASATIRRTLDDLVTQIVKIDEQLAQLSSLRPDLALMLVGDAILQQHRPTGCSSCAEPAFTIGLRLPGGVGLVIWRSLSSLQNGGGLHSVGDEAQPSFVAFTDVPPLIQRLLVPHIEGVLAGQRQRISR